MNRIARVIKERREEQGLTQEALAELSQINIRTIQRIERSENNPRGKTLSLICDALNIDVIDLNQVSRTKSSLVFEKIVNVFFLVVFNLSLMGITGFLTLDINANFNSRVGAVVLSIFLPLTMVWFTLNMTGLERLIKFGMGYMVYFLLVLSLHGFGIGFISMLFPCLFISISILYFGDKISIFLNTLSDRT
ncbi:MAG: helix-turn-helix transcriptional regulator [Saprospiraceae bacterium]|nr:helix-turn-helix transcriptional regulator [Saprospiraceae bacterium]